MKWLMLCIIVCAGLLPATGRGADDGYGYPIPGSYEATILGTPDQLKAKPPDKIRVRQLTVDVISDLDRPDVFFYDEGLRCTLAYQDKPAPLIFLIAGTGGNNQASRVVAMMSEFYKAGYHVITLPSTTDPNFIVSASRTHVPGDSAEDAADLYRAMESVWNRVKDDIEVSGFSVGGYSLGATQAAFVAHLDEEQKVFNFRKVIMVNPAVSPYDSMARIEALLDRMPGGSKKIGVFFNRMLNRLIEFYRRGAFIEIGNEFVYSVYQAKLFSHEETGALIGLSYRITSAGMIFSSDVMANGGYVVPKNRVLTSADPLFDYFWVSVHLSFLNYFDEYFYPYFRERRPGLTREAFIHSLSLRSIEGYLKSSPKFGVITNENDFILGPGEIDYLRRLFGERIKVYPRGGHCGNLEYRDNAAAMIGFAGASK